MYIQTEYYFGTIFKKNSEWDLDPPTNFHSNLGFFEFFFFAKPLSRPLAWYRQSMIELTFFLFLSYPCCWGEASHSSLCCTATLFFIDPCCWPFLSNFLFLLPFLGLSSGNPLILAMVFLGFCNLLLSLSQLFSVISHLSFWPCVQPISHFIRLLTILSTYANLNSNVSLPLISFPGTSITITPLPTYSFLLNTCPYHFNLLSYTFLDISPTFVVTVILSFLILYSLVTPLIHLNILISDNETTNVVICKC